MKSVLNRWITQVSQFGTTIDGRGKARLAPGTRRGGLSTKKYAEMSKDELIKEIELRDAIKKAMAYLKQQKTNSK
jgi:hypothetical protein